jgi:hypothetical protein
MARWMLPHTAETATMPGELVLVAAVLHQLLSDAQSRHAGIRAEAQTFLHDQTQLAVWTDLLGVEPQAFQERVALLLRPRRDEDADA